MASVRELDFFPLAVAVVCVVSVSISSEVFKGASDKFDEEKSLSSILQSTIFCTFGGFAVWTGLYIANLHQRLNLKSHNLLGKNTQSRISGFSESEKNLSKSVISSNDDINQVRKICS